MHNFGKVTGYELIHGSNKHPFMSVYLYILDDLMVDTGQHQMKKIVFDIFNNYKLEKIILTHHHEDHIGNVFNLKAKYNVTIMGNILTSKIIQNIRHNIVPKKNVFPDFIRSTKIKLLPNSIETNVFSLLPIYTPGHSIDHTAYIEKNKGWLFSGDIYLASRVKYFQPNENIADQVKSLKKILSYDFDKVFCSHNPVLKNGKNRIRRKLSYLEDFIGRVSKYVEAGMTEKEIINCFGLKYSRMVKKTNMGKLSFKNMIRSVIDTI